MNCQTRELQRLHNELLTLAVNPHLLNSTERDALKHFYQQRMASVNIFIPDSAIFQPIHPLLDTSSSESSEEEKCTLRKCRSESDLLNRTEDKPKTKKRNVERIIK